MSLLSRRRFPLIEKIPRDGLVGEWLMSGNANDTSGNGLDLIVDGAALTTDRKGQPNSAYFFDGVNDRLYRATSVGMETDTHSLSAWVYYQDANAGGVERVIASRRVVGAGFTYKEQGVGINSVTVGYIPGAVVYSALTINIQTWYHYCFVYDEGAQEVEMYINGISQGTQSINYNAGNPASFGIGYNNQSNNRFWYGRIDDVRFYNRILTPEEVTKLANE